MNFIYRIYQVETYEDKTYNVLKRCDIILNQEVMITESRDTFKENIKSLYPNIKFANNRKLKDGDIYCIIISDSCYNTEEYTSLTEHECGHCHKIFKSSPKLLNRYYSKYIFKTDTVLSEVLDNYESFIKDLRFCSKKCEEDHKPEILKMLEEATAAKYTDDNFIPDVFISKSTFDSDAYVDGYIYKISKKSTGEFYVGQTKFVPIFRWGQHLLTERFTINNISDYVFEILEVVNDKKLLNQREAYWINKCRDKNPELSLNILIPKEKPIS